MKKLVSILSVLSLFVLLLGCSPSKKLSSRVIVEEGTGYSMKKDVAFNMAVTNALAKISSEHKVDVVTRDDQTYESSEASNGNEAEEYHYESSSGTRSKTTVCGYEVIDREYTYLRSRKQWECRVSVSVPSKNLN